MVFRSMFLRSSNPMVPFILTYDLDLLRVITIAKSPSGPYLHLQSQVLTQGSLVKALKFFSGLFSGLDVI